MKTKLNKWKGPKLTINYLGNFNNNFGLAQKQTTFLQDINFLSLGLNSEKVPKFSSKIKENTNKTKRECFNFHPILIKDWESISNYNFINYVKNYSNLQRVNTSKRLSYCKRPKSSRHIYLRNHKENIKSNLNDNIMNYTTSINNNVNNFKNNKSNNVNNFTTIDNLQKISDKNSLKYFIHLKSSHSKRRKFSKKIGNYRSQYDNFGKDYNLNGEKQTKYSKFLMDEFWNYKQKEKNSDINEYEGIKNNNNFIFNNKLLRSKVNCFISSKNKEFKNLNELIAKDNVVDNSNNNKKKIKLKNLDINKKIVNENLSVISRKTSNLCEASTNTEFVNFK